MNTNIPTYSSNFLIPYIGIINIIRNRINVKVFLDIMSIGENNSDKTAPLGEMEGRFFVIL